VSYNIRYANKHDSLNDWGHRSNAISDQIVNYRADFIGLQEALYLQMNHIQTSLGTNYNFIGVGRDKGDTVGEHCPLFYRSDLYQKVVGTNPNSTFWLSETPNVPSKSWDAALPRIATGGLFQNKSTKQYIYVLNTHFDHVGNQARKNSMYMIYNQIKPYLEDNIPVILMGDFNLQPTSEPILWMSSKLTDCRKFGSDHPEKHTFNGFKESQSGPIIDYIFTNEKLNTVSYRVDQSTRGKGLFYSDHFPVIVDFK
jgi:endonuclease/exonuclease/phosphatase family metal-dependent hydrolase